MLQEKEPYVPGRLLLFADQVFEETYLSPIPPATDGRNNDLGDDDPWEEPVGRTS